MASQREVRRANRPVDDEAKQIFLDHIAEGHSNATSALAAGCWHQRFQELHQEGHPKYDPEFAAAYREACEAKVDYFREEVRRRAVDGVDDFRLDRNGEEHPIKVYSDNLLMFQTKQLDQTYRDNHRIEIAGLPGAPLRVEVEGGRATGIGDVLALARQLGIGLAAGLRDGLDAGAAQDALPAARDVLPDPRDG